MSYNSSQINQILLKADKTLYKLGSDAYLKMFSEDDETWDYERDIIFIYKAAVEWADDYFIGQTKLNQIIERLAAKLNIYDYGILAPIYVDVVTQQNQVLDIPYVLKSTYLNLGAGLTGSNDFSQPSVNISLNYGYLDTVYVPDTRTLTINGTTYDLSANRSWSVGTGTVTSVNMSVPTGFSISGNPVTSSGTLALGFAAGYSLPTNVKQSNWDDAYTWVSNFPSQTGNSGKFLTTDGSVLSWGTVNLTGYVPYTGATQNVDLGEYEIKAGQFTLDLSPTGTAAVGTTRWNNTIGSTETTLKGGNVILKNGVDLVARVVNKVTPNATLTKAQYQAVRVTGAQGQRLAVAYAQANNDNNSADTIGLVTETIATNQEGFIITVGQLEGINTTGSLQGETWADGDVLYLSPTTPGALTNVKPVAPQHIIVIGYVEYAHANNGKIYVKVMNGWELGELHDVNTIGAVAGQVLKYNGTIWAPATDIGITGSGTSQYIPKFTGSGTIGDSNIVLSSTISSVKTTIGATSGAVNNYNNLELLSVTASSLYLITSGDFNAYLTNDYGNIRLQALSSSPSVNNYILFYNGSSASNRYLSFQTEGIDRITIKQNGTVQLNNYTSNGFVKSINSDGTLSIDTTSYISLTSLFASTPLSYNNLTGTFSISQSSGTTNGFLSSTDWTTFNNKIGGSGTINYIPKFTGAGTIGDSIINENSGNILIGTSTNYQNRLQVDGVSNSGTGGIRIIASNSVGGLTIANFSSANKEWDLSPSGNDLLLNESGVNPVVYFKAGGTIRLYSYTTDGFLKTSSSNGTIVVDTTSYVPTTRQLTINGTAYDLSADRTWTVPNIYNSDGTLTGNRTVTQGGYSLTIAGTNSSRFHSDGNLTIGDTTNFASSRLQIYNTTSSTSSSIYGSTVSSTVTYAGGSTLSGSIVANGIQGSVSYNFGGNVTIPNSVVTAGVIAVSGINFTGSGTVTQNQAGSGVRSMSNLFSMWVHSSGTSGTITHVSNIRIAAPYSGSAGTVTLTNYYGLIIEDSSQFPKFSITNKWGIFQEGTGDRNFFAGRSLWGSTVDDGVNMIQVTGSGKFSSTLTANSFVKTGGTSSQYLMADGSVSSLTNPATGTGTTNYVTKWTGSSSVGNSQLFDNGTSVGINTATPNAAAIIQADSTTQGFLPPRMTAAQKTAIATPPAGLVIYQTDGTVGLYLYDGTAWRALAMV